MQKKNNSIDFVCKFTVKIIEHTAASYITLTVVINKRKNELYTQYRMDLVIQSLAMNKTQFLAKK
jgi:putative lipoic acid-binding regulatory protein